MEKLKWFFWHCSGVHIELLKKCPGESARYAGIGATIFFTGVFAFIAASFALYTVFDNIWIATFFGLIWGLMIFNLDRYIVSSMRKEKRFSREIRTAMPRIILAVMISLVIAKPLEMKIFEKEIQSEILLMEQETFAVQVSAIKARYQQPQEQLRNEIALLKKEVLDKTIIRDEMIRQAQEEADGTGGTKRRNAGPIYKIKKTDADRVNDELQELTAKNQRLIDQKQHTIARNDSVMNWELTALVRQRPDGPAGRMEALSRLTAKSRAIWWTDLFVVLLFIAVEISPVLVKLISPPGPYDNLLKIDEHGFEVKRIEEIGKTNAETKLRAEALPATEKEFITNRLDIRLDQS